MLSSVQSIIQNMLTIDLELQQKQFILLQSKYQFSVSTPTVLLYTYSVAIHLQCCYTPTVLLYTYNVVIHLQFCYTPTVLLYSVAVHC